MADQKVKTANAEYNGASIKLDRANIHRRIAEVISQHEPLASLDLDRDKVTALLHYVQTGRKDILNAHATPPNTAQSEAERNIPETSTPEKAA